MRSLLLLSGLLVGVGLLLLSGYLPRTADAITTAQGDHQDPAPRLQMRYAEFDGEQPNVLRKVDSYSDERSSADEANANAGAVAPRPQEEAPAPPPTLHPQDPPAGAYPAPSAEAGPDHTVWLGRNELALDGSGSSGDGLTYSWQQTSGPLSLNVKQPDQVSTTATGIAPEGDASWDDAVYEFELTVTDVHGQRTSDTVRYTVRAAPLWSVSPWPKRQLAFRDGYLLAHYQSWKTNTTTNSETFEIRSRTELFIHHLAGQGDFGIALSDGPRGYTYQVTVYYQDGQSTTWLEFFVDTPDRIPAILQLGVNWD